MFNTPLPDKLKPPATGRTTSKLLRKIPLTSFNTDRAGCYRRRGWYSGRAGRVWGPASRREISLLREMERVWTNSGTDGLNHSLSCFTLSSLVNMWLWEEWHWLRGKPTAGFQNNPLTLSERIMGCWKLTSAQTLVLSAGNGFMGWVCCHCVLWDKAEGMKNVEESNGKNHTLCYTSVSTI